MVFSANLLNLFGGGGSTGSVVPIDLSVLSQASLGAAGVGAPAVLSNRARAAASAFTTPAVTAPWQLDTTPRSLAERLGEVRGQRSVIDAGSPAVREAGSNPDLRTAFTAYRALDALRTLAQYAAELTTSNRALPDLDSQFQRGLAEVQAFVAAAPGDQMTLLFGPKRARVETAITVPRTQSSFTGKAVQTGNRADAVPGLTGTERFEISLSKFGRTDTVSVDLSTLGSPITLDAIAEAANGAIASEVMRDGNGDPLLDGEGNPVGRYQSRFEVARDSNGDWALRVRATLNETVRLSDPDASPGLMVVSASRPATGTAQAVLTAVDDLAGAMTTTQRADLTSTNRAQTAMQKALFDAGEAEREAEAKQRGRTYTRAAEPAPVASATTARAVAVDSQGFTYTVGTAAGDVGNQRGSGVDDLMLVKTDSLGAVVWSRVLGGSGVSEGMALAIDANDNVVVAGQTNARIGDRDGIGGTDTLVVKFNSQGDELFATQLDSVATDGARAVTVAGDGTIFVAGEVSGALSGQTGQGGRDLFVARLNATTGALEQRSQLGTAGADLAAGLAIDASGAVVLASTEGGRATVRRLDATDLTLTLDQTDLGDLGTGGRLTSLAIDRDTGTMALGGVTRLPLDGAGDATGALVDGGDAFVARLDPGLGGLGVTYLGTDSTDRVEALAWVGPHLFALGRTNGTLGDTARQGATDGFLARIDAQSGTVEATRQFGASGTRTEPAALAVIGRGAGVLATLGLRAGVINPAETTSLVSQTPLRPGDQFMLAVDGAAPRRITIQANDTFRSVAQRINALFPGRVNATVNESSTGTRLTLTARENVTIDLRGGPAGKDALPKLGLEPTKIVDTGRLFGLGDDDAQGVYTPGGTFALGLDRTLTLSDKASAAFTLRQIENAIGTVQRATRSLYFDPLRVQLAEQSSAGRRGGTVPAYLTNQISNYSEALRRLQGGSFGAPGGGLF